MRLMTNLTLGLLIVGVAMPASAGQYTIFIYETQADLALRSEKTEKGQAYWGDYAKYGEALKAAGVIRGGAPLALPAEAVSFSAQGRRAGPAGEGLALGGYFQIEAVDRAAAEALAAQAPSARRGGAVELRATYPAPGMSN